jgi:uncharacterized protein YndB with AHSA1/START domain
MAPKALAPPVVDVSLDINATPRAVIEAFFDPAALAAWFRAVRSVTTPRMLGAFAIEWAPTDWHDEVLGRLGGVLRGTIMQFEPTRGFFVADLYWLPPDAGPIGPMALDVSCALGLSHDGRPATTLHVVQSGFDESPRWRRYYEVIQATWPDALDGLKTLVEKRT